MKDTVKMSEEDRLRLKIAGEMLNEAGLRLKICREKFEEEVARIRTDMKIPPDYLGLNIDEGTFKKVKVDG